MKNVSERLATCAMVLLAVGTLDADVEKFTVRQAGSRNLGVWRLTSDPAVRDEANYHNTQCFSPNGRYTCYVHWGGAKGAGGKASAEVHVVDLMTGKDRLVDNGITPRWANHHNWLFYSHRTGNGKPVMETGCQVIRYDADTGVKTMITHGIEWVSGMDHTDTWVYGAQLYRESKPQRIVSVRVRNQPASRFEVLPAPNEHLSLHLNPFHPVIMVRTFIGWQKNPIYHRQRTLLDLDGSNWRTGFIWAEMGHACWSGDGRYLLKGNGEQLLGRRWDKPYPGDVEVLARDGSGDVSPGDRAGRYIVSGDIGMLDLRSGDAWRVVTPHSLILYPMEGDNSTSHDTDPKGSPDGTKVHYHSTRNLVQNLVMTKTTKFDPKNAPDVLRVEGTDGFPSSGDLVFGREVVGYSRKTATTFEGLTRRNYDTPAAAKVNRPGAPIFPLSAYVLNKKDQARAKPSYPMLRDGFPETHRLMYQRQTDCYIAVARLPFRPHLRLCGSRVELIPGEHHWETRGYRLLRNGKPVVNRLLAPGESFTVKARGVYTAKAVEWSGLASPPSLPLEMSKACEGRVLKDKPADFSWTRKIWKVEGKIAREAEALRAGRADMELVHLHDGVIAREQWKGGRKVSRVDLNEQGKPIRHRMYREGRLIKRIYKDPDGNKLSLELFGPDGWKTEYVSYYTYPEIMGKEHSHWWYDHGRPIKKTQTYGGRTFDTTATESRK